MTLVGLQKDDTEAARWFRKAAEQNLAVAQLNLGIMYDTGQGVAKDLIQAHAWLNLAGANGEESAYDRLATIEKEITPEERTAARKLAHELLEQATKAPRGPGPATPSKSTP